MSAPPRFLVRRFSGPGGEEQRNVWGKEAERLADVGGTFLYEGAKEKMCFGTFLHLITPRG